MVITRAHLGSQIALLLDNPINTTETKAKCQVCIKWSGIVTPSVYPFLWAVRRLRGIGGGATPDIGELY